MTTTRTLLLAALLAASSLAQADSWFLPNKAGGRIVLTDRPCPAPESKPLREAYAYEAGGDRQSACWTIFDDMIQITWERGGRSVFSLEDFTPSPGNKPAPARGNGSRL